MADPADVFRLRALPLDRVKNLLFTGFDAIQAVDRGDKRMEYIAAAYQSAAANDLRVIRSKWQTRDNRLGVLARPVDLSGWPECTVQDAEFVLARKVWCDAVRMAYLADRPL